MSAKPITAGRLREVRHYNPETGVFTHRVKAGHKRPGDIAGADHNMGYVQVQVGGRNYLAHRLAWLYVTGQWPDQDIDHIDGDKKNNWLANLRDVSAVVNGHNRKAPNKNNRDSGLIGVSGTVRAGRRPSPWTVMSSTSARSTRQSKHRTHTERRRSAPAWATCRCTWALSADGRGRARLTEAGQNLLDAMAWL